jgi:hypothetical protein
LIHPDMPADADKSFRDQDVGNPVQPCDTGTHIHDVRLLNETSSTWVKVKKAKKTTHRLVADVGHATKDEILDAMRLVGSGDILTWSLHTWFPKSEEKSADPIATGIRSGTLNPFGSGDAITTAEIIAALQVGTPPAVVIMCGCASHQFISAVLGAGVAVAFGVGRDPDNGDTNNAPFPSEYQSLGAADAVTAALMNGESLTAAAGAAVDALNLARKQYDLLFMALKARAGLDKNKSLQDNHLL